MWLCGRVAHRDHGNVMSLNGLLQDFGAAIA